MKEDAFFPGLCKSSNNGDLEFYDLEFYAFLSALISLPS